jgi:hypothetical protein
MGREIAHELIKKHATTTTASNFFNALASEKDFPLSINELNNLIKRSSLLCGQLLCAITRGGRCDQADHQGAGVKG